MPCGAVRVGLAGPVKQDVPHDPSPLYGYKRYDEVREEGEKRGDVLCLFPLQSSHLLSDISGYWGSVPLPVRLRRHSRGR